MSKYRELFIQMTKEYAREFSDFMLIHDKYAFNPEKFQLEFNEKGQIIVDIIRIWEKKLCSKSESGKFSKYSSSLSDKFWVEVRKNFPKIVFVGCKVRLRTV
jgi:hypothetical protein